MSSKPPSVPPHVELEKKEEREGPPTKPPETRKQRLRRYGRIAWKWSKRAAIVFAALFVIGLVTAWVIVRQYEAELPSVAELEKGYRPSQVTRVLARDGTLLAELFTERRTIVKIEELPLHLKKAVLAAEDATFYEHEGLNYAGIARAMAVNLRAGGHRQGGSTITQQVVKNILLGNNEKTYKRKLREALLARRLEQELCPECGHDRAGKDKRKDKILELYLNHIYFGHGRYGIEEASRDAFGKSARELTIAEAALLAGVVKNPEAYAPKRGLAKALERRKYVLEQMLAKGFINKAEFDAAIDEPVRLAPSQEAETELAPEAVSIARKLLMELEPERGPRGGFTITTTIDPRLQAAARKSLRENLAAYDKRHNLLGPWKAPSVAQQKGKGAKAPAEAPLFDGVPAFESHKVFTGVVVATDDVLGTIDVRVGQAIGSVKIADYKRYNPNDLKPSQLAEVGARLRVSLLAPVPAPPKEGSEPSRVVAKVPLRLELGPESASVVLDVRTRHVLALAGNYEAVVGGLDRATQSRRQPGSTFKPVVYSYALHARRYTPATLVEVKPVEFPGKYKPSNYEGWKNEDPLRLRECLANSVNVAAVHVLDDARRRASSIGRRRSGSSRR
jgi:penicillin-binding protein 1A